MDLGLWVHSADKCSRIQESPLQPGTVGVTGAAAPGAQYTKYFYVKIIVVSFTCYNSVVLIAHVRSFHNRPSPPRHIAMDVIDTSLNPAHGSREKLHPKQYDEEQVTTHPLQTTLNTLAFHLSFSSFALLQCWSFQSSCSFSAFLSKYFLFFVYLSITNINTMEEIRQWGSMLSCTVV